MPAIWKSAISERTGPGLRSIADGMIVAVALTAGLYFGGDILEPLAIAALLAFILSPAIRFLRDRGVWRTPATLVAVALAVAVLAALSSTIAIQIGQLAEDLPKYEGNLRTKIRSFGGGALTSGVFERASGTLKDLQKEIGNAVPSGNAGNIGANDKPLVVEVHQPKSGGLEAIANFARPLLSPLTTTALTVLFLMFILFQREDIRDRLLRLAGTADLHRSTEALDDAATRLSRYFLMQTLLNVGFGIVIGTGLTLIGIPNATLWGILAGLMRFVPYVGTAISVFFPLLLAAAVDPGWTMVLATAALFGVTEPIAGQVIEPILYGQHTGLSPVAILVASMFWALLWGPIGLLLATPLTVCVVVLGRHIEALEFIDVLLGDEPALEPEQSFYQRLLANDATEAADQAEALLKQHALSYYYDDVPMKALALAQTDAATGKLSREKQLSIKNTMDTFIEDLDDYDDVDPTLDVPKHEGDAKDERADSAKSAGASVLCVPCRSPLDEAAAGMARQLMEKNGLTATVRSLEEVTSSRLSTADGTSKLICLSYFGAVANPVHVRFLVRRLKRRMPDAIFIAGFWMLAGDAAKSETWRTSVGADFAATSLAEAVAICAREAEKLSSAAETDRSGVGAAARASGEDATAVADAVGIAALGAA